MRSILLHIDDDDCLDAKLQVALDLARTFGGHIECLQAVPVEIGVPGDLYGVMATEVLPQLREAADRLRERIQPRLASEDVAWSWLREDGFATEKLIERSGLSDVIVLGCRSGHVVRAPSDLPGEIAVRARTPILLVPQEARGFDPARPALVAWDGSPEACRALRAATPLLTRAERVILATVAEQSDERQFDLPPTEGAEYLSRHDIDCEMVELPAEDRSIGKVLAGAAEAREVGYLVMGAYGHMRLAEMIWGGVTRKMFANPPLPIFALH